MIPKIIHYCWFGNNPMPAIVQKCLNSWHEKMPDYDIKLWNETNIPIHEYDFMHKAYLCKKWAFVSDYARYWILEQYGGFFLDSDVELLRSFDCFRQEHCFFAFNKHIKQNILFVNPGLAIGVEKGFPLIKDILNIYNSLNFIDENGLPHWEYSSPRILTKHLLKTTNLKIEDKTQHLNNNVTIYATEYFDPINPRVLFGNKLEITENTYSIHHGAASWVPLNKKIKRILSILSRNIFGDFIIDKLRGSEHYE